MLWSSSLFLSFVDHYTKAFSIPTEPRDTSSGKVTSNVPLFSKTEPVVFVFPPAFSVLNRTSSATQRSPPSPSSTGQESPFDSTQVLGAYSLSSEAVPTTSASSLSNPTAAVGSEPTERQTLTETMKTVPVLSLSDYMVDTNVETSSSPSATIDCSTKTAAESPAESSLSAEMLEIPQSELEREPIEDLQTKNTDSGVTDVSHATTEEPLTATTIESPVETVETRPATFEGPVEPIIDVTGKDGQIKSTGG